MLPLAGILLLAESASLRRLVEPAPLSSFRFPWTTLREAKVHAVLDRAFQRQMKNEKLFADATSAFSSKKYFKRMGEYINHIFSSQVGIWFSFTVSEIEDKDCTDPFLCDMPDIRGRCESNDVETSDALNVRHKKFAAWIQKRRDSLAGAYYLFTGCSYKQGSTITHGIANVQAWCDKTTSTGMIMKGATNSKVKTMFAQAQTLMHELGHTVGMRHFGKYYKNATSGTLECYGIMDRCSDKVNGVRRFVKTNWEEDAKHVLNETNFNRYSSCFGASKMVPEGCTLGNNVCESNCNTADLNYDGGDCDANSTGVFGEATPVCAPGCYRHFIGDGICDPDCMVPACWNEVSRKGKSEKADCKCFGERTINKCQGDAQSNVGECLRQCKPSTARDVLGTVDELINDAPSWFKENLRYAIIGFIAFITLCCILALFFAKKK